MTALPTPVKLAPQTEDLSHRIAAAFVPVRGEVEEEVGGGTPSGDPPAEL